MTTRSPPIPPPAFVPTSNTPPMVPLTVNGTSPAISIADQQTPNTPRKKRKEPPTVIKNFWFPFYTNLRSPCKFEGMQREASSVSRMADVFDGFQFIFTRALSQEFNMTHALTLPTEDPAGYSFNATAVSKKWLLTGKIDSDGVLMGRCHTGIFEPFMTQFSIQTGPEGVPSSFSMDADWRGPDCTVNVKHSSSMGMYSGAYMQQLTPELSAGVECQYWHTPAKSLLLGGMRYDTGAWIFTGLVHSMMALTTTFSRKLSRNVSLHGEYNCSLQDGFESEASFGYEYRMDLNTLRAYLDTSGTMRCVLEERFSPVLGVSFCGEVNIPARVYKFGFGLSMQLEG